MKTKWSMDKDNWIIIEVVEGDWEMNKFREKSQETDNVISYQELVLKHTDMAATVISNAHDDDTLEIAENHIAVLKELLRPDSNYKDAINILNEEYGNKIAQMNEVAREANKVELRKLYTHEHFGILMELMKRRKFSYVGQVDEKL